MYYSDVVYMESFLPKYPLLIKVLVPLSHTAFLLWNSVDHWTHTTTQWKTQFY